VAASEYYLVGARADRSFAWLAAYEPVARVGESIRLYHFPDKPLPPDPPPPGRCW
jgi:hypothetical protein